MRGPNYWLLEAASSSTADNMTPATASGWDNITTWLASTVVISACIFRAKYPCTLGEEYVFMDNEDYTPYNLNKDSISDEVLFINESTAGIQVILVDGNPVGLDLPSSVELEVLETDPSIKGASATSRTKPATLSTGLVIQVPEHISTGDVVKINTEEKKFMGRGDK